MNPHKSHALTCFCISLLLWAQPALTRAETITVAVAANFAPTLRLLTERFQHEQAHQVRLVAGSSGLLAAQIRHGAPYDLFYSADASKPKALIDAGLAPAQNRYTYAIGRLVLWSSQANRVDTQGLVLHTDFQRLALANPKLAPYGLAALDVLTALKLTDATRTRRVMGENIAQTYQFVATGNADLGFIALAQWQAEPNTGSHWLVPSTLHRAIRQDALMLHDTPANRAFWQFMRSPAAQEQIRRAGYDTPEIRP